MMPQAFAIDKQHIISRTRIGVHLANGDAQRLIEVEAFLVLDKPASRDELFIDLLPGFGFVVGPRWRCHYPSHSLARRLPWLGAKLAVPPRINRGGTKGLQLVNRKC